MSITLETLAELTASSIKGDKSLKLHGVASLDAAKAGQISFVSNPKFLKLLDQSQASAFIITSQVAEEYTGNALINDDPYLTYAKVVKAFHQPPKLPAEIHSSAVIADTAVIGDDVNIAANVVIEDKVVLGHGVNIGAGSVVGQGSQLGENTRLHANVTLYSETIIGKNSMIHSGTVIGADGFGYAPQKDKSWYKILQVGNVVIGDDVEIGASTTIDRAALGSTYIADGVKLDNQIQIAHNVKIGKYSIFAGGTGVAGSTEVGAYCQVGGYVAIGGHLHIADGVVLTGNSMVTKSIKNAGIYSSGIPVEDNRTWHRNIARYKRLDSMAKTIKQLEKQLTEVLETMQNKKGKSNNL